MKSINSPYMIPYLSKIHLYLPKIGIYLAVKLVKKVKFRMQHAIFFPKIRLVLGSFLNLLKLGSARLASQKARLGSARQKVGSGASLVFSLPPQSKLYYLHLIHYFSSVFQRFSLTSWKTLFRMGALSTRCLILTGENAPIVPAITKDLS